MLLMHDVPKPSIACHLLFLSHTCVIQTKTLLQAMTKSLCSSNTKPCAAITRPHATTLHWPWSKPPQAPLKVRVVCSAAGSELVVTVGDATRVSSLGTSSPPHCLLRCVEQCTTVLVFFCKFQAYGSRSRFKHLVRSTSQPCIWCVMLLLHVPARWLHSPMLGVMT